VPRQGRRGHRQVPNAATLLDAPVGVLAGALDEDEASGAEESGAGVAATATAAGEQQQSGIAAPGGGDPGDGDPGGGGGAGGGGGTATRQSESRDQIAVRLHAVLEAHRELRTCGCVGHPFDVYGYHLSGCTKSPCSGVIARHDRVVTAINYYCKTAGLSTKVEKTGFFTGLHKSDIAFMNPATSRMAHIDVVVPCAAGKTNVKECERRGFVAGAAAADSEKKKIRKYAENAQHGWTPTVTGTGRNFYPVAIESHGRFGESAKELVWRLAQLTANRRQRTGCDDSASKIHLRMVRELSFSIAMDTVRGIKAHADWAVATLLGKRRGGQHPSHLFAPVVQHGG